MTENTPLLADELLHFSSLNHDDASRLILELLETTGETHNPDPKATLQHCRHVIQLGAAHYAREQQTHPFHRVVDELIRAKIDRRSRTLSEIRQYCTRIIKQNPDWHDYPLRQITTEDCRLAINNSFDTPTVQRKAWGILHSLFAFGITRGLCDYNPLRQVECPRPREKRIEILTIPQIKDLLDAAQQEQHLPCAPALGLMLWAGIRPNEIERIKWGNIHIEEGIIEVEAQHAKTGGARHVHMQPILIRWLRKVCTYTPSIAPITPKAWTRRWKSLRDEAGLSNWQADILRHTFASYHLKQFKDLAALQLEMGHSNTKLLQTRYLSMTGLSQRAALQFWGLKKAKRP